MKLRRTLLMKRITMLVFLVFGVLLGAAWARTRTESVLHSFCSQNNCTDGEWPSAGVVFNQKENLYGTTSYGGAHGGGAVFKISLEGKETVLYSFCAQANCADGGYSTSGLVFDKEGNLYGTASQGGAYGGGVVFKLTPEGKETVIYSFCAQTNCADGGYPTSGLVFDKKGNLYGTTPLGGVTNNLCKATCGVAFKLTPQGKYTVVHSFCVQSGCADGEKPLTGLVVDQQGNLYGTTRVGGAHPGGGTVFKITPKGKETVLYDFCSENNCTDGANPYAGLIFDQQGNLYGTTYAGGAYNSGGVVFKLAPGSKYTVLYNFCALPNCTDGELPSAGLTFDRAGNLYGTTEYGGTYLGGTVFKLMPGGKERVLYSFCAQNNCPDGGFPLAGLVFDQKGNLYGTTFEGGAQERGVVFRLTP